MLKDALTNESMARTALTDKIVKTASDDQHGLIERDGLLHAGNIMKDGPFWLPIYFQATR